MTTGNPIAVVALGGHAFMRHGHKPTHKEHQYSAEIIADILMKLVKKNYNIVITHGNGPQVGNLLIQNENSQNEVPAQPLDVLVAMTEGSLGYILQQSILNQLKQHNIQKYVVTKVTQVVVDSKDPAFQNPTKPIGPFLSEEEAKARADKLGWNVIEDSGRGWRRIVPSPKPQQVVQRNTIKDAVTEGHIVIAAGGGGIPVIKEQTENNINIYKGVEAVIDKDLTSALLAKEVGADLLIILTDVEQVYINYRKENQQSLGALTIEMTEKYYEQGHFAKGSMGPKIKAILNFLKTGGKRALITSPNKLEDALEGLTGTHFVGKI